MKTSGRRTFLGTAGAGAAALAMEAGTTRAAADRRIVLGLIGPGGMGTNHLKQAGDAQGCRGRLRLRCRSEAAGERRQARRDRCRQGAEGRQGPARGARRQNGRRRLHRHARPLARAGRHPGAGRRQARLRREAVLPQHPRRPADDRGGQASGKLLQVGTQSRSTAVRAGGHDAAHEGEIGDVLVAKAWNSQLRRTIGKTKPSKPPAHLDYDLWVGPAPMVPYHSNLLPGIWRWWYDFGCGDIGNDGVHDIDVACWGLGVATHPVDRRLPGRQVLLRRRSAVSRHAVRRLRVSRRGQAGGRRSSSSSSSASGRPTCRKATRTAPPSTARRAC